MYKKIETFRWDSDFRNITKHPHPVLLNLISVQEVSYYLTEGTKEYFKLTLSGGRNYIIDKPQADEITQNLLDNNDRNISDEIHHLNISIRNLTNLLQARLR